MKSAALGPSILAGFALAVGNAATTWTAETNPTIRAAGLEAHESQAGASLLGQFRTSTAAWMYLRADLYLHNGVEMRALTAAERAKGQGGVGGSGEHAELESAVHDAAIVTVVPDAAQDFRGFLGDLERSTSAYQDMRGHHHNDLATALPLFRLMTWVDPHFIAGWTFGAMILNGDKSPASTEKAFNFLSAGLQENPESIEILCKLATTEIVGRKHIPEGVSLLERARQIARAHPTHLSEAEEEATLETYRWLLLAYNKLKKPEALREASAEGLARFPDDKVLLRLSKGI